MKILHAITSIDKGGAENHLTSLAKIQKDNHFDVNIFYTTKSDYWKSFYATNGIRVHKSCYVLRANLISKIIKFYSDIIELIEINKRFKPDVIHAHLPYMELVVFFSSFFISHKFKFIISKHVDNVFFKGSDGQKKSLLGSLFARIIAYRSDRIIAISKSVKNFLISNYVGINKKKISVVYYGLDKILVKTKKKNTKINFRKKFKVKKNEIFIGCIARLVPQKSLTTLIDAIQVYKRNKNIKLVIAGSGNLKEELINYSNSKKLQSNIIWVDFIDDTDGFLKSIDIFALSSLYEGFGLVFLEAMYCKKPIIGTKTSAIKEVVKDKLNGILVPINNSQKISKAIEKLENKQLRNKYGLSGYEILRKKFPLIKMFNETKKVYEKEY